MADNRKPKTYQDAGITWLRQVEGFAPPNAGEVAIQMPWIDVTDYVDAATFNEDAIDMWDRYGGEYHYPTIVRHA